MTRLSEGLHSQHSQCWSPAPDAACESLLTRLEDSDNTQLTREDLSSSEFDSSDESDSTSSSISTTLQYRTKKRRWLTVEESKTKVQTPARPISEVSSTKPTADSFFSTVSSAGYPASNAKMQTWKKHWSLPEPQPCHPGSCEMMVLCPLRWDYGEHDRSSRSLTID